MDRDYDVIVVGAGIGGLGCAALLSHAGLKTLVLEKNNFIGGRCCSYKKNDCTLDVFIHMFATCEKGPFGEIMRQTEMPDAIKFWHADPANKPVLYLNGKPYVYPDPGIATDEEMENTFRGLSLPREDYEAAMRLNEAIYNMPKEETHEFNNVAYLDWIKNYSSNEGLLALHHDRSMLMGVVGIFEASAGEVIRMTQNWHLKGSMGYPIGGCQAIPDGFAKIIRQYGGEIRTGEPAAEILIDKGAASGVRLKTGEEISAGAVVSNAGLKETAMNLIPEGAFHKDYHDYVGCLSCGMFGTDELGGIFLSVKVLLDEPVIEEPVVFAFSLDAQKSLVEAVSQDSPEQEPPPASIDQFSTFMPIPSNMDPSLVPPGRQLLNFPAIAAPGETDLGKSVERQMSFLEMIYPGIKRRVLWWDVIRGKAIKSYSGRLQSDIIGLAQIVGQVGLDRPPFESPVKGLFYIGADVGKDNIGTELAAESALRAAPVVRNYLGK
jgi:phytoene dehydrogenase-like protein